MNNSYITANDIVDHIKLITEKLKDPVIREKFLAYEKAQLENEEILISNNQICDKDTLITLRERISKLKPEILKKDVTNKFYNAEVMKAAMCTIESVIYAPPDKIGSDYHNGLINEYITNLRQIGTESKNGYAMLGNFDGIKDFFIDKVSRNPNNDTLIHELVVGLYGTNKLREHIPNFSYIYGGLKCSPPLIDPVTKKVIYSCLDNDNLVNYVLYENVAPAINISTYVSNCTATQFLNVYLQALYSLRLANKLIDYTHYDLHAENLLIRESKLDKGKIFQIPYETENGIEYLRTNVISTFIDYGYSHIKTKDIIDKENNIIFKGQHFGVHGRTQASIFPNRSWIIYDAYRLLIDCLRDAYNDGNKNVIREIKKIFKFFNPVDDPIKYLLDKIPGMLPLIDKTENLQLDDLIKHIRKVCNCNFISLNPTKDPILNCESLCESEEKILSDIGLTGDIQIPNNIPQFYDLLIVLNDQNKTDDLKYLIDNFDYEQSIYKFSYDLKNEVNDLINKITLFDNNDYPDISKITDDILFRFDSMSDIKQIYIDIGTIFSLDDKINNYIDIAIYVANIYEDDKIISYIDDLIIDINKNIDIFTKKVVDILIIYDERLNNVSDDIYNKIIDDDERLDWYWDDRINLQTQFFDLMNIK